MLTHVLVREARGNHSPEKPVKPGGARASRRQLEGRILRSHSRAARSRPATARRQRQSRGRQPRDATVMQHGSRCSHPEARQPLDTVEARDVDTRAPRSSGAHARERDDRPLQRGLRPGRRARLGGLARDDRALSWPPELDCYVEDHHLRPAGERKNQAPFFELSGGGGESRAPRGRATPPVLSAPARFYQQH